LQRSRGSTPAIDWSRRREAHIEAGILDPRIYGNLFRRASVGDTGETF
jgi:hypothetical protein